MYLALSIHDPTTTQSCKGFRNPYLGCAKPVSSRAQPGAPVWNAHPAGGFHARVSGQPRGPAVFVYTGMLSQGLSCLTFLKRRTFFSATSFPTASYFSEVCFGISVPTMSNCLCLDRTL